MTTGYYNPEMNERDNELPRIRTLLRSRRIDVLEGPDYFDLICLRCRSRRRMFVGLSLLHDAALLFLADHECLPNWMEPGHKAVGKVCFETSTEIWADFKLKTSYGWIMQPIKIAVKRDHGEFYRPTAPALR